MKKTILLAMLAMGCGTAATATAPTNTMNTAHTEGDEVAANDSALLAMDLELNGTQSEESAPEVTAVDANERELARLPQAPWTQDMVNDPANVVTAWQMAANRSWCAPMTTTADLASARGVILDGGWAVEFDRDGAPGMTAEGETCVDCGRATFGIAGTALGADEAFEDSVDPTFADGSAAAVEQSEGVAAATVTVQGQGCVYQVWSFLGEAHVRSIVDGMRFVETSDSMARAE